MRPVPYGWVTRRSRNSKFTPECSSERRFRFFFFLHIFFTRVSSGQSEEFEILWGAFWAAGSAFEVRFCYFRRLSRQRGSNFTAEKQIYNWFADISPYRSQLRKLKFWREGEEGEGKSPLASHPWGKYTNPISPLGNMMAKNHTFFENEKCASTSALRLPYQIIIIRIWWFLRRFKDLFLNFQST